MKAYYHHVGQKGADSDFPKTVFNKVNISLVENSIPDTDVYKRKLVEELRSNFPEGDFNCWGVPEGANLVIKNLKVGDIVLLVENTGGLVPALCNIRVYYNHQFPGLSQAFWGAQKYPYIFFFETESLNLTWLELSNLLGYDNYDPRGKFYSVADERLKSFGGVHGFLRKLRDVYSKYPKFSYSEIENTITPNAQEEAPDYLKNAQNEFEDLRNTSDSEVPNLYGGTKPLKSETQKRARDEVFTSGVKKLYKYACGVCSLSVMTPKNRPEVEAAHIYPKSYDGADDFRNGIALCHFHHWAFDNGWFSISDDLRIIVRKTIPKTRGYEQISNWDGHSINIPKIEDYKPHPVFLKEHRKLHGFE